MKKVILTLCFFMMVCVGTTNAQALNLKIGLFSPEMNSDLWETNMDNLALIKQDMRDLVYAIEYEQFFRRHFSVSIEGSYFSKDHFSQYRDYEYDDGSPIYQNLALEITGVEINFKLYPNTYRNIFCPFIGAGMGIYYWHYEQWGEFLNFDDFTVEEGYADTSAYTPGFNVRAGFMVRFSRSSAFSFEAKYQYLKGQLSSLFEGFDKLDMSGLALSIGFNLFMF